MIGGAEGENAMPDVFQDSARRTLKALARHGCAALRVTAMLAAFGVGTWSLLPAQASIGQRSGDTCCTVTVNGPAVAMKVTKQGTTAKETFHGKVNERVSEVLTDVVSSDQGCETLTLLNPSGGTVDDGSDCGNGNNVGVGPDVLTVAGTYTVKLQVDSNATGGGKLWVSAPVSSGPIAVNGPAKAMDVTRVGQGVERTFTGKVHQQISVVVTNVVTSDQGCETLTLLNPSGGMVDDGSDCGNGNNVAVGPDVLTVAGTYTVRLEADNTATATSKLWVSAPVSRGTVTVNGPAEAMNATRVGQGVERTFSGTARERIKAVVSGIVTSDQGCETLTLLNPSGGTVDNGSDCGNGNPIDVGPVRLGKTGTYTVLFQVDTAATGSGKLKITS
jgi:hypothetical protein